MDKIGKLFARVDALKEAHPDMTWGIHCITGGDGRTMIALKCICPANYCLWENPARVVMTGMYFLEDGVYTVTGCSRKITALEKMYWGRFDEIASYARREQRGLQEKMGSESPLAQRKAV